MSQENVMKSAAPASSASGEWIAEAAAAIERFRAEPATVLSLLDALSSARKRIPTEDEIEALEVAIEELDALETKELAAHGYSDAGPWIKSLRALVQRNTEAASQPGVRRNEAR